MLVVFFCVMMKILEFSSGHVIINNNIRNSNINHKNDIKSRQRRKGYGRGKRHCYKIMSRILLLNKYLATQW
jgi:hypothetical protein